MPRCEGRNASGLRCKRKVQSTSHCPCHAPQRFLPEPIQCSICFDTKTEVKHVYKLKTCPHTFCKGCITAWVDKGKNTCPMCRTVMDREDILKLVPNYYTRHPPKYAVTFGSVSTAMYFRIPEADLDRQLLIMQELRNDLNRLMVHYTGVRNGQHW